MLHKLSYFRDTRKCFSVKNVKTCLFLNILLKINLLKIRTLAENRAGGVRKLASDIGMSEANIHQCITANKIQAGDLEKIAHELNVPVGYFFDEAHPATISQRVKKGNATVSVYGDAATGLSDKDREIEYLREIIKGKDEVITMLKENAK
jgi:DNA-binding Xre family transcriptional regulator